MTDLFKITCDWVIILVHSSFMRYEFIGTLVRRLFCDRIIIILFISYVHTIICWRAASKVCVFQIQLTVSLYSSLHSCQLLVGVSGVKGSFSGTTWAGAQRLPIPKREALVAPATFLLFFEQDFPSTMQQYSRTAIALLSSIRRFLRYASRCMHRGHHTTHDVSSFAENKKSQPVSPRGEVLSANENICIHKRRI